VLAICTIAKSTMMPEIMGCADSGEDAGETPSADGNGQQEPDDAGDEA